MITRPTVLVLGAGASNHLRYPLGKTLVNRLCKMRPQAMLGDLPKCFTIEQAQGFLLRMSRWNPNSVDAFLEANPDDSPIGKYLMASVLKQQEDLNGMFPPEDPGWYSVLFNAIFSDANRSIAGNKLTVVTFNYDRSLEAFLHQIVQARCRVTSSDAAKAIEAIPIIHVHGILGEYPRFPYKKDCEVEELNEIAAQIQIVHEIRDSDRGFCNTQFEKANAALRDAERIVFLGFGFLDANLRRFQFFNPDALKGKEVRCTAAGLSQVGYNSLMERMRTYGFLPGVFERSDCNSFFDNYFAFE